MTAHEVLDKYLTLLYTQLEQDVDVMSRPWMYWCLLIPIFVYLLFFMVKWWCLLVPITLPISLWVFRPKEETKGQKNAVKLQNN